MPSPVRSQGMTLRLAIIGADGGTGRHATDAALSRGHAVRSLTRDAPQSDRTHRVEVRTADILSDDLAPHLEGCDAVLNCVGLPVTWRTATHPPPLHTDGTRAILRAMEDVGISRLVVISAAMVATRDLGPPQFRLATVAALERIYDQMGEMEHILRASRLDWTAVRPGQLTDAPATGRTTVTAELPADGLYRTSRADLGAFMVGLAEGRDWVRGTPVIVGPDI